jgi:hypothetical protein
LVDEAAAALKEAKKDEPSMVGVYFKTIGRFFFK